jgi:hypothetical protein
MPLDWLVPVLDATVARITQFAGGREIGRFVPAG